MRSKKFNPLASMVAAVALTIGLAACGGSSNTPPADPPETPMPTPFESAQAGIAAATTPEAAQAAYDAVKDDVTAAEGARLQAAVDARKEVLATMDRAAAQKMALTRAAGSIDTSDLSTQAAIDAAKDAIADLEAALARAADVSDADKAMYRGRVTAAEMDVADAQSDLDHAAQTMALSDAVDALGAIDLGDLSDEAKVDAAEAAIAAIQAALDAATELSAAEKAVAMTLVETANRTVMAAQGRMDMAGQRMALMEAHEALGAINLNMLMTQEQIDAANAAIIALDLALAAADDLSDADKIDALTDVTLAKRKVEDAEETLTANIDTQRTALMEAGTALAALDLTDLDTAEKIADAKEAVDTLKMALANATHLSDAEKAMRQSELDDATETVTTAETGMDRDGRMTAQRTAITDAVTAVRTAVAAVNDTATDDQVTAADEAVARLKAAIDGAGDLPEGDTDVAEAKGTLTSLEGQLASAKTSRTAAMEAEAQRMAEEEAEAEKTRNAANAATAAKLYAAVSPASGDGADVTAGARFADINPVSADDPTPFISVNYGGELETAGQANSATLNLDKDTTVADHRGWEGNRYVEKDSDGNVITEAVVYSDENPTPGDPFDEEYALNAADAANPGELPIADAAAESARVASSSFDQSAGVKEFKLGDNQSRVAIPGSYHGVSGTYYCTAAADSTCAANVAADGFTLGGTLDTSNAFTAGGGTWTFKPTNAKATVMEGADDMYAVYGWWLRMPAGNGAWTASAFADYYGTPDTISGLGDLRGSATYTGGAAGKYALSSTTGGTNDSGHFTARATLEADFNTDTITGTIDQFMSDGAAKDWSVALNKSDISDAGAIAGAGDDDTGQQKTVWTIGDDAAAASGRWEGDFRDVGDNGVPGVVTGDFFSEFGNSGKMVGAFGAKTQ